MVKAPGVVLGRKGVVGSVHFVEQDFWPHDTSLWVKDFHGNDPRYVYYFFRGHARELSALDVGSANPTLNRNHVHPIEVPWPSSLDEQRLIAGILGSLDDRITLLRETNTTLEAIAQALFKSWFVDFDPVHSKMQGRAPEGMDEATAALFPDSFEESELGPVPKGWQSGNLKDLLNESTSRIGNLNSIVLSAVQTGHLVPSDEHFTKKVYSANISNYKLVQPLAFAYNPSRINIGSIGLNEKENTGAVSPIYVVASAYSKGCAYFVWHHLRTKRIKEIIKNMASGTVRQSVSFRDFGSIPLVIPSDDALDCFYQIREILYSKVKANNTLVETLIAARDTLLPRLISGQLSLTEVATETI